MEEKEEKILKNYQIFFRTSFWNSRKITGLEFEDLREALDIKYEEFLMNLAAFIYNQEMIPYEEEVFKFSSRIFNLYDNIKFKEKQFTHIDISNYTYKYFFEADLVLLEGDTVSEYFLHSSVAG